MTLATKVDFMMTSLVAESALVLFLQLVGGLGSVAGSRASGLLLGG